MNRRVPQERELRAPRLASPVQETLGRFQIDVPC